MEPLSSILIYSRCPTDAASVHMVPTTRVLYHSNWWTSTTVGWRSTRTICRRLKESLRLLHTIKSCWQHQPLFRYTLFWYIWTWIAAGVFLYYPYSTVATKTRHPGSGIMYTLSPWLTCHDTPNVVYMPRVSVLKQNVLLYLQIGHLKNLSGLETCEYTAAT